MAPVTRRKSRTIRRLTTRQSVPKDVLVELSRNHNKECMFCGQKEISEKSYGILYQFNDIIVHYFCILLSSRAVQNGEDKDGILGFLIKDIKAELNRGSREICVYCKKNGATISCCEPRCRKIFHLPCGLKNGSMHQFYQKFKSFCSQHRMTQVVDINELQNSSPVQCTICKDHVLPTPLPDSIWAPCCRRNAWFHRDCIQDLALSAGYFFKCPLCNNVEKFKSRMLYLGIYIPSRDASWETVPNAFAELLERHNTCDATTCLCPHRDKRNFQQESGSWEIILCYTCGSHGTHKLCSSLKVDQEWSCVECIELTELANKRQLELSNGNDSTAQESMNASSSNLVATNEAPINGRIHEASKNVEIRDMRRNRGMTRNVGAREATRNVGAREATRNVGAREATRNVGAREATKNVGARETSVNRRSRGTPINGRNRETPITESNHETTITEKNHETPINRRAETPINGRNSETLINVRNSEIPINRRNNETSINKRIQETSINRRNRVTPISGKNREAMSNLESHEALINGENQEVTTSNVGGPQEAPLNEKNLEVTTNVNNVEVATTIRRSRATTKNIEIQEVSMGTNETSKTMQNTAQPRYVSTRESSRLNNKNRETNYNEIPSTSSNPIFVSDDSNDSDVLLVKYVEPPKQRQTLPEYHRRLSPPFNDPNYPRICTVGTLGSVGTIAPRRFIANQLRNINFNITDNIDLTSDENDDVVIDSSNLTNDNDNNNNVPQ